jgi:hypothetical protein
MNNYRADNLAQSLERIAQSLESDAKGLRDFAAQLRNEDADYTGSALLSNVTSLVTRTLNNSSYIGTVESAIYNASELVRGDK